MKPVTRPSADVVGTGEATSANGQSRTIIPGSEKTSLERKIEVQTAGERYCVTAPERKLLRYFFGFSNSADPADRGPNFVKRRKDEASYFVRKMLFSDENSEEEEAELFRFQEGEKEAADIDLAKIALESTITNNEIGELRRFLSQDGIQLTDKEICAILQTLTRFCKVYPTAFFVNRGRKAITAYIGGRVSRKKIEYYTSLKRGFPYHIYIYCA